MTLSLQDCWAKTDRETGRPALTVQDHCIAAGAVACAVRDELPAASANCLPTGGVTVAAVHDLGKVSPGFLTKAPAWTLHQLTSPYCETDHARIGQFALANLLAARAPGTRPGRWVLAVGGHHGSFPSDKEHIAHFRGEDDCKWPETLRSQLLDQLVALFGALPPNERLSDPQLLWLTGFVTFCDWIASDEDFFPLLLEGPMRDRLRISVAREQAHTALAKTCWSARGVRKGLAADQLFRREKAGDVFEARPLQLSLREAAAAPGLYIVEAAMGAGKTEAAALAAYRRWTEGAERGLYFGLPTQLTSNRIHDRIAAFLHNIVADPTVASLVHGNSWLREDRLLQLDPTTPGEMGAAEARHWMASGRKALLAPFATGTIDQALMAVLPARHAGLRLFALSGKVVVLDEIHSYDPYTSALVDRAIEWLLEVGCTIIVLSATLTAARRREMIAAAGATELEPCDDYPLITKVGRGEKNAQHHRVLDDKAVPRRVTIEHWPNDIRKICAGAVVAAEAGACVLIVRNTVALAQETFRIVQETRRQGGPEIGLLHSRFAQFQRDAQEGDWMRKLGAGDPHRPKSGCILLATQVVEQSVDLDADLLITDLAPTDLLLQRIGRLHRHERVRPEPYREPVCRILQPAVDWSADLRTIREQLGPSAYVYPPYRLFQAQTLWRPRSMITLPSEIRCLLESTYGEIADLPAGAAAFQQSLDAEIAEMKLSARQRIIFNQPGVTDREGRQTRWGAMDSAFLVLFSREPVRRGHSIFLQLYDGREWEVNPYRFDYELAKALHENAVRLPRWLIQDAIPKQPDWFKDYIDDAALAWTVADSTVLDVLGGAEALPATLSYDNRLGLFYERRATLREPRLPAHEMDLDGWF